MTNIWGKVVGGALGFAIGGGALGALVGVAVGHAYDTRHDSPTGMSYDFPRTKPPGHDEATKQALFTTAIVTLSAKVAKADGRVNRTEIDAFKNIFQIKPHQEKHIGRIFDNARGSARGFEPYAFQLAQVFNSQPSVLEEALNGLFVIAAADDRNRAINPNEMRFLKQVAYIFNFTPEDFRRIAAHANVRLPDDDRVQEHERSNANDPLGILGLNDRASNDEIKAAYRALIQKHHPDKLAAEGLPAEMVASATENMKRINAAYDAVCKIRKIK